MPAGFTGEQQAYIGQLLAVITTLVEETRALRTDNQQLRDEVAKLKGICPRPVFKGSALDKKTDATGKNNDDDENLPGAKRPGSSKQAKTALLPVHETRILKPAAAVPVGSRFKGYSDVLVQDLTICANNILFRRERWELPDGQALTAELPAEFAHGHFGPTLRGFLLYQHHQCHVTQPLLREQLREWGVSLSTGHVDALLSGELRTFAAEKQQILQAGLQCSPAITVDDSTARHLGKNGIVTNISGPCFAWFKSTVSKSRLNFLELLHAGQTQYELNPRALQYCAAHGTPFALLQRLKAYQGRGTHAGIHQLLDKLGVSGTDTRRTVVEGALWGALQGKVHNQLAIVSDGAGQFIVGEHGLCWVHTERLFLRLIPGNEEHGQEQEQIRKEIWALYARLKRYKAQPDPETATELSAEFNRLFTQKTSFAALEEQLARAYARKEELLLVLRRPDVPLHTNQSETDIRDFVKKRKVSGGTRSALGQECRDTFATLKKTCRKLGVSFWQYLQDRLLGKGAVAPLPELIRLRMAGSFA